MALTQAAVFGWGAAGAAFGFVFTQLLPVGVALTKDDAVLRPVTGRRIGGFLIIAMGFAGLGGLIALGVGSAGGDAEAKTLVQAITYGIGWQGLFGGLISNVFLG
jgi:hypothetical protein